MLELYFEAIPHSPTDIGSALDDVFAEDESNSVVGWPGVVTSNKVFWDSEFVLGSVFSEFVVWFEILKIVSLCCTT